MDREIIDAPMPDTIRRPKQRDDYCDTDTTPLKIFRFSQKSQLLSRYV